MLLGVLETARKVAARDIAVLISGESGTGKELIAREIHQCSRRRDHRFVAINCGAIPEALLESELFGHRKGAFTGADRDHKGLIETANGGTLFLDEVGTLPLNVQKT
ncbi:sigma-54 factor interaction domain-containing protein, partial [Arthrospira platensis SPKY1]|nr:sigma-54 factor interaction domain-containing protein [Arthrospira platensis SPKY1]